MTPAEYSSGTEPKKENDMEGSNTNNSSTFNSFSRHKNEAQKVFIVILIALLFAYVIAAVIYFIFQGKFSII